MSDWRNNPLVISLAIGSAVLSTTLFIVFNYVIPVYQKDDSNKIAELTRKLESKELLLSELTNTSSSKIKEKNNDLEILSKVKNSEIERLNNEKKATELKLTELESRLTFIDVGSLYQKGALLPIGYDAVEVGQKKDVLFKYYGAPRLIVDKSGDYISVNLNYAGIDSVVYYLDRRKKDTISHIVVFKGPKYSSDSKIRKLVDNLSFKELLMNNLGFTESCKDNFYIWNIPSKKVSVYYDNSEGEGDSYSIHGFDSYPWLFDDYCTSQNLKKIRL